MGPENETRLFRSFDREDEAFESSGTESYDMENGFYEFEQGGDQTLQLEIMIDFEKKFITFVSETRKIHLPSRSLEYNHYEGMANLYGYKTGDSDSGDSNSYTKTFKSL